MYFMTINVTSSGLYKGKKKRSEKGDPKGYDFLNCTFGMAHNYVRPYASSSTFLTQNQTVLSSLVNAATFNDFFGLFMWFSSDDVTYSVWDCVMSFCWVLCHVGALNSLHWGGWPTDSMPPIKCWQRWAQNMLPFLPIASGDTTTTRRKKMGPPRHSTHALASIVKHLKTSTCVL